MLVQRWLGAALTMPLPPKGVSAEILPHATTGYLGLAEKIAPREYGLEELIGEGSKYRFELRRFRGSVSNHLHSVGLVTH